MKIFNNKYVQIGLVALLVIIATVRSFRVISFSATEANGYDEQMWTSVSITNYYMYFKNYVRPTQEVDNWLPTYAWKSGVDIFTGDSLMINPMKGIMQYQGDTIKFPYDQVTITTKKEQYALAVKYDTLKFPRKDFQWFDRATWTFGWKAPNLGKYIMGWWIKTFASSAPSPNGYFEFFVPKTLTDTASTDYIPSEKPSPAPYSYAPQEYQLLARQPNAIMYILTIIAVILAGWFFFHFWVGFISGAWMVLNTTFLKVNCIAGLDSFAVCFSTLAFLLLLATVKALLKNEKWWKIIVWGAGTGIVSAFAISSKLNAGMVVISEMVVFGMIGLISLYKAWKLKTLPMQQRLMPALKIMVAAGLTAVLSILIFIRLNPQVQHQPKARIAAMRGSIDEYFDRRARIFTSNQVNDRVKAISEELIRQSKTPGTNQQELLGINAQLMQINQNYGQEMQKSALNENKFHITRTEKYIKDLEKVEKQVQKLNGNFEMNKSPFVNWIALKHSWPMAFELVTKRLAVVDADNPDRYYGTFGSLLKFGYNPMDGLLAIAGIIFCVLLAWKQWKEKKEIYTYAILLVSFLLIFYGNVDFVWQDWQRYMTPIFPLYALVIGVGIFETIRFIQKKVTAKKTVVTPAPTTPVQEQKRKNNPGKK